MEPRNPPSAGRGTATPRRKYAPRACQECRRRRAKCDGQKPSCVRCVSRGKVCVFTDEVDNRGSAPKSYVALLQARIKLLEKILLLHSIDVDASVAQLEVQRTDDDHDRATGAYSTSMAFNEMCAGFEGALYIDEPSGPDDQLGAEGSFFGPTSGRLELQSTIGDQTESPELGEPPLDLEVSSSRKQSPCSRVYPDKHKGSLSSSGIEDLCTPELQSHLLDLYFKWEQPWYQIVDEEIFRDSLKNAGHYSSPLLLCCILAMASRYSDQPQVRTNPSDPDSAGRAFFDRAEILLRQDLKSPRITTLQSLGIMSIYHVAVGSDSLGWLHNGMAQRLLLDMGLNLDTSTLTGPASLAWEEVQLRRQVYWTLYCTDKLWAIYTGRVCTMLDSQGAVPFPMLRPSEEEGGIIVPPRRPRQRDLVTLFSQAHSTLAQILEKIMSNLYAPKRLASTAEKRNFFTSCILSLQGWYYSLPKDLKTKSTDRQSDLTRLPQTYLLNMVYHTSIILLAKPFISSSRLVCQKLSMPHGSEEDELAQTVSELCLEAAAEIALLGNSYREIYGSFHRSPVSVTHCTLTAALVLLFVQPNGQEVTASERVGHLRSCMRTLQELSVSWSPALRYWRTLARMSGPQLCLSEEKPQALSSGATRQSTGTSAAEGLEYKPEPSDDPPSLKSRASLDEMSGNLTDMNALFPSLVDPDQLWASTDAQLFTEASNLDLGAFDALSWDCVNHPEMDFETGSSGFSC